MEISRETKVLYFSELKIYDYIVKIDNYEEILGDEIKNFEKLTDKSFKIKIGSLPNISLFLEESKEEFCVKLKSSDVNMNFSIIINVNSIDDNSSKVNVNFVGKFSTMIEMMLKNPLEKFIDSLKNKLESLIF